MNFFKYDENNYDLLQGTCLQGYLPNGTTYRRLVEVLGEPSSNGDGYKVDAEWILRFEDGTVASIYNYKDGLNYNTYEDDDGNTVVEGTPVEDITYWHIGGHDQQAVQRVTDLFTKPVDMSKYTEVEALPLKVEPVDLVQELRDSTALRGATLCERAADEIERLRREGTPGVMHEVDRAFYEHTVTQRDTAYCEIKSLRAAVDKLTKALLDIK